MKMLNKMFGVMVRKCGHGQREKERGVPGWQSGEFSAERQVLVGAGALWEARRQSQHSRMRVNVSCEPVSVGTGKSSGSLCLSSSPHMAVQTNQHETHVCEIL